ncbi:unnamed protein product, partial [Meganyctiphanes norvegica]
PNKYYLAEPKNASALAEYVYEHHFPPHHYWLGARGDGSNMVWGRGPGRRVVAQTEPWGLNEPFRVSSSYCMDLRVADFPIINPLAVHLCRQALNHFYICECTPIH